MVEMKTGKDMREDSSLAPMEAKRPRESMVLLLARVLTTSRHRDRDHCSQRFWSSTQENRRKMQIERPRLKMSWQTEMMTVAGRADSVVKNGIENTVSMG